MAWLWGRGQYEKKKKATKPKELKKKYIYIIKKKPPEIFLRCRLKKHLLRNWFANWKISSKAREVSLKFAPAFFWPWPCLAPTPCSSPAVPIAHARRKPQNCSGAEDINPRTWKNSTGKIQPDAVELSKRSHTMGWYFMSLQLQLRTSRYTQSWVAPQHQFARLAEAAFSLSGLIFPKSGQHWS